MRTLSELAAKCSGSATVLGGPPECPQRPYCQAGPGESTGFKVGSFTSLDAGGPLTKNALPTGTISVGPGLLLGRRIRHQLSPSRGALTTPPPPTRSGGVRASRGPRSLR